MRNAVLTFVMLFSVALMAQEKNIKPTFEKDGDIITATYFHENGEIAQTGEMLNNKPHGKWVAYDVEGNKTAVAYYNKGIKPASGLFGLRTSLLKLITGIIPLSMW